MEIIRNCFLVSIILFISSCSDYGEEEINKLTNIENQLTNVQNKIYELELAIDDLRSETNDFSYENWRENVTEVEEATTNVEYIFNDLQQELILLDNDYSLYKKEQIKIIEDIDY